MTKQCRKKWKKKVTNSWPGASAASCKVLDCITGSQGTPPAVFCNWLGFASAQPAHMSSLGKCSCSTCYVNDGFVTAGGICWFSIDVLDCLQCSMTWANTLPILFVWIGRNVLRQKNINIYSNAAGNRKRGTKLRIVVAANVACCAHFLKFTVLLR